jgi:hypothetical protein
MITKNFDFGWREVKSVELQQQILTTYLRKYYEDHSNTVLVNTTWLETTTPSKTKDQIDQEVINFANDQYAIFAGSTWPDLQQIMSLDSFENLPESINLEILNFKFKINQCQNDLRLNNHNVPPLTQVKDYILEHKSKIDNVIVYSFLDPPKMLPFLDNQPFNVIKIGGNPKPNNWVDFQAVLVDKFFVIDDYLSATSSQIDIPFMCLNGKPHSHRYNIVKALLDLGLDKLGLVSFGGQSEELKGTDDYIGPISIPENHIRPYGVNFDIFDSMSFGDINNWNRHFLNVVTETEWDVEYSNFWSEKIFKPIIGYRPFLVYAPNGCVNILTEHGFLHYCNDFADISDLDLTQPDNIPIFLTQLCAQPTSYLTMKYNQLFEKIQFNRQRFDSYVAEQWGVINQGLV